MAKSSKPKFYAVARGSRPGVYMDWDSCRAQVDGFRAAKFKSFPTREMAVSFVAEHRAGCSALMSDVAVFPPPPSAAHASKKRKVDESFAATEEVAELIGGRGSKVPKVSSMEPEAADEAGFTVVWTDGSSRGNGQDTAVAGVGVFFGLDDPRNVAERLAGARQTNQRAELTAIIRALEGVSSEADVIIKSDSQYSISCFTQWHQGWARNGWKNSKKQPVENKDLVQKGLALIQRRSGKTRLVKVKAHVGILGNEMADQLANAGALKRARFESEPRMC